MVSEPRSKAILIRMEPTVADMLAEMADADGLSRADVVRQLIRRAHAKRFPPKRSKKANR